jgi:hypothetical protein
MRVLQWRVKIVKMLNARAVVIYVQKEVEIVSIANIKGISGHKCNATGICICMNSAVQPEDGLHLQTTCGLCRRRRDLCRACCGSSWIFHVRLSDNHQPILFQEGTYQNRPSDIAIKHAKTCSSYPIYHLH